MIRAYPDPYPLPLPPAMEREQRIKWGTWTYLPGGRRVLATYGWDQQRTDLSQPELLACERCGQWYPLRELNLIGGLRRCGSCAETYTRNAACAPGQLFLFVSGGHEGRRAA